MQRHRFGQVPPAAWPASAHSLWDVRRETSLPKGSFDSRWGATLESFPFHNGRADKPVDMETGGLRESANAKDSVGCSGNGNDVDHATGRKAQRWTVNYMREGRKEGSGFRIFIRGRLVRADG